MQASCNLPFSIPLHRAAGGRDSGNAPSRSWCHPGASPGRWIVAASLFLFDAETLHCHLASLIDKRQSIFTTHAPLDLEILTAAAQGKTSKLPTMEELAEIHTQLIARHNPAAPCILVGYCFRGLLAMEVAHRLKARGFTVASVILIDTPIWEAKGWNKFQEWARHDARAELCRWVKYAWKKANAPLNEEFSKVKRRMAKHRHPVSLPPKLEDPNTHVPWDILSPIQTTAMQNYRPRPLDCAGVLFLSFEMKSTLREPHATRRAQAHFAGGLEFIEAPGKHLTMLKDPHIQEVAARLNHLLASLNQKHLL